MEKKGSLFSSFKYAFSGIFAVIKKERNIKIHLLAMILVSIFGFIFKLSTTEWLICLILFGVVLSAELFNTAIEVTVDLAMPEKNEKAKLAKDAAAGAVLILAIFAAIIGIIIFAPKIIALF